MIGGRLAFSVRPCDAGLDFGVDQVSDYPGVWAELVHFLSVQLRAGRRFYVGGAKSQVVLPFPYGFGDTQSDGLMAVLSIVICGPPEENCLALTAGGSPTRFRRHQAVPALFSAERAAAELAQHEHHREALSPGVQGHGNGRDL